MAWRTIQTRIMQEQVHGLLPEAPVHARRIRDRILECFEKEQQVRWRPRRNGGTYCILSW